MFIKSLQLITILLALFFSGNARASAHTDCTDACFSGFSCPTSDTDLLKTYNCKIGRDRCVAQCNKNVNQGMEAPPPSGAYGAIAYDKKSGAWGMANASQDKKSAEESALGYCKKYGSDCKIVKSFVKQCGAVATGTGNRLGWAVNDDARQASLDSIKKCGVNGKTVDNTRCFLQIYHCYVP
jgi:hypothetical protein